MTLGGAIDSLQKKGACLMEQWPFELEKVNQQPDEACFEEAMTYKISSAIKVPAEVEPIKECLAEGFPIVFGLKLTQRFFKPLEGGYIPTPDPDDPKSAEHGLHAMLLVGYNERKQVFIVRNSWGSSWGDNGYAYVPYDYIANKDFNFLGQYAIKGLTNYDLTPDDDDGEDAEFAPAQDDGFEDEWEAAEDDDEDDVDDDFDESMFSPKAEAMRAFRKYDLDDSGSIDGTELFMCLMMNGIFVMPWEIQGYMDMYDKDGSGKIGFSEFCAMCGIEV
mmetsp:Transcript_45241/g.72856  ORF Transcript_45241/g.72856 Transcript_45241/m.72856 type:complete len:276 (-) Transcript_45241:167-994(-)